MVQTQFNTTIKCVQSDWGGEYRPVSAYLACHGTEHRLSCPYTQEHNGAVERQNRTKEKKGKENNERKEEKRKEGKFRRYRSAARKWSSVKSQRTEVAERPHLSPCTYYVQTHSHGAPPVPYRT
ncbi:hypothetical protein LXL04_018300 [Taraxacum kok-saghyz]